jgi:apolipoprotein N-acyltransferase
VGVWPLIFIALIPFFLNIFALQEMHQKIRAALLMGIPYAFASGEALFRLTGTWWTSSIETSTTLRSLEYTLAITLIVLVAALFYVIPLLIGPHIRKLRIPLVLIFAFSFSLTEFIRSLVLLGYSWGALGYTLIDAPYIKHVAALVGVYGLTFIIILWNSWGALLIARYIKNEGSAGVRLRKAFFAEQYTLETITLATLIVATLCFGLYREARPINTPLHLRVAVFASTISTGDSIDERSYQIYRSLFVRALEKNPNIILTPENIFPYFTIDENGYVLAKQQPVFLQNAEALYADFLALTREHPGTTFAIATHSKKNGLLYNSILLYRNGTVTSVYHKRRLLPFSEYAPLDLHLPLFENFTKGTEVQDFYLDAIPLAGYICSEINIVPLSTHGAPLILSSSNDSVFVSTEMPVLHQTIARMRALEAGAYLLRSTKGGISSIIDPYGNAIATMSGENGVLIADIPEQASVSKSFLFTKKLAL